MTQQTAEGIDEITELKVAQRRPEYRECLRGKSGETTLAYIVPQEGISRETALAIEQRVSVYEQFTQQIRGIGRKRLVAVIRDDVTEGCRGFAASHSEKYATLIPGERITFKIQASSDLEKAMLDEIKTVLEKGLYHIWMKS
jgi:hypothetical protein